MAQKTEKYKVINTKVSPEAFAKIYRLADKLGMTSGGLSVTAGLYVKF